MLDADDIEWWIEFSRLRFHIGLTICLRSLAALPLPQRITAAVAKDYLYHTKAEKVIMACRSKEKAEEAMKKFGPGASESDSGISMNQWPIGPIGNFVHSGHHALLTNMDYDYAGRS